MCFQRRGSLDASPCAVRIAKVGLGARAHGTGGSVTVLCGSDRTVKRAMLRDIESADPPYSNTPICLSRFALRVWET